MTRHKINKGFLSVLIVICASIFCVGHYEKASAIETQFWWSGEACALDAQNCGWSVVGNWNDINGDPSEVAPSNEGGLSPILIFPSFPTAPASSPVNDIEGLTVTSINFLEGDFSDESYDLILEQPVTVTNSIVNTTNGKSSILSIKGDIILGSDIYIQTTSLFLIGPDAGDTVDLNGHELSFIESADLGAPETTLQNLCISGAIIGASTSSSVSMDNGKGNLSLVGANTFNGQVNVASGGLSNFVFVGGALSDYNPHALGNADVNVSYGGYLRLGFTSLMTELNNKINITGASSTPAAEESFGAITFYPDSNTTVLVPNVNIISGQVYMENLAALSGYTTTKINLNGITIGAGASLKFLGLSEEDGPFLTADANDANGFTYGVVAADPDADDDSDDVTKPAEEEKKTTTITAPNTVIGKFMSANPALVATMGLMSAAVLFIYVRRRSNNK